MKFWEEPEPIYNMFGGEMDDILNFLTTVAESDSEIAYDSNEIYASEVMENGEALSISFESKRAVVGRTAVKNETSQKIKSTTAAIGCINYAKLKNGI